MQSDINIPFTVEATLASLRGHFYARYAGRTEPRQNLTFDVRYEGEAIPEGFATPDISKYQHKEPDYTQTPVYACISRHDLSVTVQRDTSIIPHSSRENTTYSLTISSPRRGQYRATANTNNITTKNGNMDLVMAALKDQDMQRFINFVPNGANLKLLQDHCAPRNLFTEFGKMRLQNQR